MGQSLGSPCESRKRPSYEAATSSACLGLVLTGAFSVEETEMFVMYKRPWQTLPQENEATEATESRPLGEGHAKPEKSYNRKPDGPTEAS